MALHTVTPKQRPIDSRFAGSGDVKALQDAVKELQALKIAVVAGAAADTNIAITGIETEDTLLSVLQFNVTAGDIDTLTDRTSEAAITSAGNIQLADTATTGDTLLVFYYRHDGS